MSLRAPFPWFGGKSLVAPAIWQAWSSCVDDADREEVVAVLELFL